MGLAKHFHTQKSSGRRVSASVLRFFEDEEPEENEDQDKKPEPPAQPLDTGQ